MAEVKDPTAVIKELYAKRPADGGGDDFGVTAHFSALIASGAMIPVLTDSTADRIPNQTLVRFRGMVQDMLDPEYFYNEYRTEDGTWRTARYQDAIEDRINPSNTSGDSLKFGERRSFVVVPVPGETAWVADTHRAEAKASMAALNPVQQASGGSAGLSKRPREEEEENADADAMSFSQMVTDATDDAAAGAENGTEADSAARRRPAAPTTATGVAPAALPAFPAGGCMVYVYSKDDVIRLNDVIEVVGVLSRVPELAAAHLAAAAAGNRGENAAMAIDEDAVLEAHPPTSQAPRLHAVLLRKEESPYSTAAAVAGAALSSEDIGSARSRALGLLSQVLGGDDLAAEYLLLQLVSSVHHRSKEAGALGVLPLNLTGCPPVAANTANTANTPNTATALSPLGAAVTAALQALTPRCLPLPLTLQTLNSGLWTPRRAAEAVTLTSGALQMAAGTQVVVDETVLQAGQLTEVGLRNLAALQGIMSGQKIGYEFPFYALEQPTDAPVTVLSTARTMLKGVDEVVVPLRPPAPLAEGKAAVAATGAEQLALARAFLAAVRGAEFSIPESVAAQLEAGMAAAKQKDGALGPQTFHLWLTLARLLTVSHGEKELTAARWDEAQRLEAQRQQRLAA